MKKICFVIPRTYYLFNPEISDNNIIPGGAQTQVYYLSTALAEDKKFDIHFAVADFGQKDFETREKVKLHKAFNFSDNIFKRTVSLLKVLKRINASTYIFRSADTGVAFVIFYVKFFLKKKTLYMLASDVETSKREQKKFSGIIKLMAMQQAYNFVDIITAQTLWQAKLFQKYRKRKPDAIIKNIYHTKDNYHTNKREKNIILWVGRLTKIKNPEIFLYLARKYKSEKFVMIAPIALDKKEYGNTIIKKVSELKNIQYFDYVKPSKMFEYYSRTKIYVLTSDFEGFPNTMAEAMQAKCPVLSYNVNPDNILNKFRCGYCAEKKIDDFYTYFDKFLKNPEIYREFGENGAKYIANHHEQNQIIDIFKKLL